MNGQAVRQLQNLRQLRERRAANQLANQQRAWREATQACEQARAEVEEARERVQREAEALQRLLGAGALPVGTYQTALETLEAFDRYRVRLDERLQVAEQRREEEEARRVELQRALLQRQRQCEALEPVLEEQARQDRRVEAAAEEELYDERASLGKGMQS